MTKQGKYMSNAKASDDYIEYVIRVPRELQHHNDNKHENLGKYLRDAIAKYYSFSKKQEKDVIINERTKEDSLRAVLDFNTRVLSASVDAMHLTVQDSLNEMEQFKHLTENELYALSRDSLFIEKQQQAFSQKLSALMQTVYQNAAKELPSLLENHDILDYTAKFVSLLIENRDRFDTIIMDNQKSLIREIMQEPAPLNRIQSETVTFDDAHSSHLNAMSLSTKIKEIVLEEAGENIAESVADRIANRAGGYVATIPEVLALQNLRSEIHAAPIVCKQPYRGKEVDGEASAFLRTHYPEASTLKRFTTGVLREIDPKLMNGLKNEIAAKNHGHPDSKDKIGNHLTDKNQYLSWLRYQGQTAFGAAPNDIFSFMQRMRDNKDHQIS